ncbi:energy transducer TonB [Paracidovorax citrulli]
MTKRSRAWGSHRAARLLSLNTAAAAIAVLACAAPPAGAAEYVESSTDAQLRRIVRTFYVPAARSRLIAAARDAGYAGADGPFGCVARTRHEQFVDALLPPVSATLNAEQLKQAGRFLDSRAGKLMQWHASIPAEKARLGTPAPVPGAAEAWREFTATEAGKALATPPAPVQAAVAALQRDVLARCAGDGAPATVVQAPPAENLCEPPRVAYPPAAKTRGQIGAVQVWLMLDVTGQVESTAVYRSSGIPALDAAAETAVQGMRCRAYRDRQGNAISAVALQPIQFKLAPD